MDTWQQGSPVYVSAIKAMVPDSVQHHRPAFNHGAMGVSGRRLLVCTPASAPCDWLTDPTRSITWLLAVAAKYEGQPYTAIDDKLVLLYGRTIDTATTAGFFVALTVLVPSSTVQRSQDRVAANALHPYP